MEENSSLFQIEYEICQNCDLRYTDHDSHLSNCSKHELTCNECFKTYRRGSYSNHKRKCDGVPDDVTFTQVLVLSFYKKTLGMISICFTKID
jgi:hypothetical protein